MKRNHALSWMLCAALLCLTGCGTTTEPEGSSPESLPDPTSSETEPATEAETSASEQSTEAETPETAPAPSQEEISPAEMYKDVLELFDKGLSEGWQSEPESNYGTEGLTADSISYLWLMYSGEFSTSNVGYQFTDLNNDGTCELVIAPLQDPGYENMIYELYTCDNQHVVHLLSSGERDRFGIDANGLIAEFGSSSAMDYGVWCYQVNGGALECCETYQSDGTLDHYFHYGNSPDKTAETPITQEEFDAGIAAHAFAPLQLTPFSSLGAADATSDLTN